MSLKSFLQKTTRYPWGVVLILILALILRLWGTGFGLPYEYHIDENQYVRQAATLGTTLLRPFDWTNPPFFKYILFGEYGVFFLVGKLLGWFSTVEDFGSRLRLDPTWLYLLARWTSALMGSLTVLVVYAIGKHAYNKRVGLLSAIFFATAFLPVRESHFAVNDAPATLWVALVLLAAVNIAKKDHWRWYILGGVAFGLGMATKYYVLASVTPLIAAFYYSGRRNGPKFALQRGGVSLLSSLIAAVVASPYFLIEINQVFNNVSRLASSGRNGFDGWLVSTDPGYIYYLNTLIWGLGGLLCLACLVGIVFAFWRHSPVDVVIVTLPLAIYLFLGSEKMFFGRLILPAVPALTLLAAAGVEAIVSKWLRSSALQRNAFFLLAILFAVQPLINSIQFDTLLSRSDTRTIARNWIESNISEGSSIAVDWVMLCPQLSSAEKPVVNSTRSYRLWVSDFFTGKGLSDHSIDWYQEQGYQYLVTCSFINDLSLSNPNADAKRDDFYASLDQQLTLVKEFLPYQGEDEKAIPFIFDEIYGPAVSMSNRDRPGPVIKIYQIKSGEQNAAGYLNFHH